MFVSISGVDPELTKLTNPSDVMVYMQNKSLEDKLDPAEYSIKDLKKWIVHFHNKYRAHHSSPAVTVDSNLTNLAQKWSDEMAFHKKCLVHEQPSKYGENLTSFASSKFPSPKTCAAALIHGFYTEGYGFNYTRFNPGSWSKVGHFTQLLWKNSRKIGVGVSVAKRGTMYHVYVCIKYDPPGNMQTSEAYMDNVRAPKSTSGCGCLIM
ncbi:SCP domain-containing protein [Caenorhabditis elegans]|uniref:SCP domain-containing protein n=1 Tax=Caenorhabditis elegans TaxID=6239 RepID=Q93193_CAEEL|nr:SCP domain-containing protein [Caenorhabditis elegans]CAB01716.2 SCP domain-containing protein [Caenorhabditis elegans]|eukprot:NP_509707.2 Uncharacterized protein CELE_C07A4.3 [Caenorhabditis elegans]